MKKEVFCINCIYCAIKMDKEVGHAYICRNNPEIIIKKDPVIGVKEMGINALCERKNKAYDCQEFTQKVLYEPVKATYNDMFGGPWWVDLGAIIAVLGTLIFIGVALCRYLLNT